MAIARLSSPWAAKVRRDLETKALEDKSLQEQVASLKEKLKGLQGRRQRIEYKIQEQQYFLSTIRSIPDNVLSMIFLCFFNEYLGSPWILMSLCRAWRRVASKIHQFWSGIIITGPGWQETGKDRRHQGREICGNIKQLNLALKRANVSPLDLMVLWESPRAFHKRYAKHKEETFTAISSMLFFLHTSQSFLQVQKLHIDYLPSRLLDDWYRHLDFRNVEIIRLDAHYPYILAAVRQTASAKLSSLELMDSYGCFHLKNILGNPSIKNLVLTPTFDVPILHTSDLKQFLKSAIHVINMTIFDSHPTKDLKTAITLPNLQRLNVGSMWSLQSFQAPRLTELTITSRNSFSAESDGAYMFPSLATLTLTNANGCQLTKIRAPNLHTLSVSKIRDIEVWKQNSLEPGHLNPVVLRLVSFSVYEDGLVDVILAMSRLEVLEVTNFPLTKTFFEAFKPRRVEKGASGKQRASSRRFEVSCPSLHSLRIDFVGLRIDGCIKETRSMALKVMKARAKAGHALTEAMVRYTLVEDWVSVLCN